MRIVNAGRRLVLLDARGAGLDVEKASDGRFSSDPQAIFTRWDEFREWAAARGDRGDFAVDPAELGAPTPLPRQVFAIGLNYADHVRESKMGRPDSPTVFTKFQTSITGRPPPSSCPAGTSSLMRPPGSGTRGTRSEFAAATAGLGVGHAVLKVGCGTGQLAERLACFGRRR